MVMSGLPRWIEYGLVLLAAWLVSGIFINERQTIVSPQHSILSTDDEKNEFKVNEALLKKVHLFGEAVVEETKEEKKPVAVTVSKLNVKLIGTVVAGHKSAAMVMMNGSTEQQVFFIGESMQPQVILRSVRATEITVDNHGKTELISIEAGKAIVSSVPSQIKPVQATRSRPSRPTQLDRRVDRSHLQKQLRNFSTLLSQARVTPHFTDKKADGFTISEIVKGSLYEEIGLQNGDVIQKVNGESVTSAEQAMRMYRELQNSTFIDVEISRGGSVQQISYTIQ